MTQEGGTQAQYLQQVAATIQQASFCNSNADTDLCAGSTSPVQDSCQVFIN